MPIFQLNSKVLKPIKELKFDFEKDIQSLTEENLETVFGLRFVRTEFESHGLRVDTLAYDPESKAFVIIEYKRDRSFSVIDQGFAYLSLLQNYKAEFILEYNERTDSNLRRDDVDWTQSRAIFIAHSFTTHQRLAINFKDLPFSLWEVRKYDNNTIAFNPLISSGSTESIKTISSSPVIQKVVSEVKQYTVEDHLKKSSESAIEAYQAVRDLIITIDPRFKENPKRHYIGFNLGENGAGTLVYIHLRSNKLLLYIPRIKPSDIRDPEKRLTYVANSMETKNTPTSVLELRTLDDVAYAAPILRQAYKTLT